MYLGNESRGGAALVLPCGREDGPALVITGQAMDAGLDEDETELTVTVLAAGCRRAG